MANLALAFDILARDRASKTFDHVGASVERAGHKGQMFGTLLKGAAGFAAGGAVAIAGLGAAAAVMGIKTAAANEQAQISFTTMLGSGQKAAVFLKQLQQFAAATPFEFPELQTAASSLISAGINAKDVIPIMRTLGDVTSGMGTGAEGVQRATIALQQMNAAGRITGEDLNQLRDAGIPVYDLLSKATGKSKAEVVKLAQAGKLGKKELDQMMKALESGKGLERFSGLMDKQSRSLSGLWSTFHDTLNMGLAKAIEPLIPLLKDGLGRASTFLAAIMPKVAAGFAMFMKWVAGSHPRLAALAAVARQFGLYIVGTLWPAIQKGVQTVLPALKQALAIIGGAFKGTGDKGADFKDIMKSVGDFITKYAIPALAWLAKTALPLVAKNIRLTIEAIKLFIGFWQALSNVTGKVVTFILTGFAKMASGAAVLLDALSHVPGFGWAKDAADKLRTAAGQANALADAIKNIPHNVIINTYYATHGSPPSASGKGGNVGDPGKPHRAGGGSAMKGFAYWVGDNPDGSLNSTSELFVPGESGTIYNQKQLRGMGGGTVRLHPHDIAAIVDGITARPNKITAGSVDAAMGGRLR